jgi:predicted RNase H-like HicB family nuclease
VPQRSQRRRVVRFSTDTIHVEPIDGRTVEASLVWCWRLLYARPEQREHWQKSATSGGMHRSELDVVEHGGFAAQCAGTSDGKGKMAYTATYRRIPSGYLGQIVEWPQVVTEGKDLDDCRESLKDALREMLGAYRELGRMPPESGEEVLLESISASA